MRADRIPESFSRLRIVLAYLPRQFGQITSAVWTYCQSEVNSQ